MDLFAFYMQTSIRPVPFVKKTFLFFNSGFFIRNQMSLGVWIYAWISDLIPLINVCFLMLVPCVFITVSLKYNLKSEMVIPPEMDCFSYAFFFSYEVEYCSFKVCKQ